VESGEHLDVVKISNHLDNVKMPTYHHGNLRAALVQAATELVEERGDAGLTLRAVGRRLGVSRSAPYHHFASKDELVSAVALDGFRRLHERLAGAAETEKETSLRRFALQYVRFGVTHQTLFRMMHRALSGHPAAVGGPLAQAYESHRLLWARVAGSPERGLVAWSTMHGLAVLWIDGPLRVGGQDQTVASLVTTAVDGLR
jgi:AcrR family transcriptional regulator